MPLIETIKSNYTKVRNQLPDIDKYTTRKVVVSGWIAVSVLLWFGILGTFNKRHDFARVLNGKGSLTDYEGTLSLNCDNGTVIEVEEELTYTIPYNGEILRGGERYIDFPIRDVKVTSRNYPTLTYRHVSRGDRSVILWNGLHVPNGQETIKISYVIASDTRFIIMGQDPTRESIPPTGSNLTYTLVIPSIIPRMASNYSVTVMLPFVAYSLSPSMLIDQLEFTGSGQSDGTTTALHIANQINMTSIIQTDTVGNCSSDLWKDTNIFSPRTLEEVESHLTLVESSSTIFPLSVVVFFFIAVGCLFVCLLSTMLIRKDDIGFVRKLSPLEKAEIKSAAIVRIQALFRGFRQRKIFRTLLEESRGKQLRRTTWKISDKQRKELKLIRNYRQDEMDKQVRFEPPPHDFAKFG